MTLFILPLAALLLLVSALLSAAETAAFALSSSRLRTLEAEGFRGAEELGLLRERPETARGALIVASVMLDGGAVGLVASTGALDGGWFGGIGGMITTLLLAVFAAEVFPRVFAARRPVRIALGLAPTLAFAVRAVNRVLAPLGRLNDRLDRKREEESGETAEDREVREMTAIGRQEGLIEEQESLLVERVLRLDDLTARDVMTPRVDMFTWDQDVTLESIVGELSEVPYSRVPVHKETVDEITGILYVREALETYVAGKGDVKLSQLAREPLFVPGSSPLDRLLENFKARRIHMGIVADEFGGTDGLVTLEDVLEELVGEIEDETDEPMDSIVRISRNEILVEGSTDLRELNHAFNISLPLLEHRSLNGLILEHTGSVPSEGDTVELAGVVMEVLDATETQVVRVRLKRVGAPADPEAA